LGLTDHPLVQKGQTQSISCIDNLPPQIKKKKCNNNFLTFF
jgi:hypothetical protein